MPESTRSSLFPDINVWIALSYEGHAHHAAAVRWFTTLDQDSSLIFCRFTQLGLLRLLTAEAVMGDEVMTQPEAWDAYDRWQQDDRVELMNEPSGLEPRFRTLTRRPHPAPKDWADSYLAAFAASGELDTGHLRSRHASEGQTTHPVGRVGPRSAHKPLLAGSEPRHHAGVRRSVGGRRPA
jgi:toxin-antitoxin system PIN domain toxin